ncbi:hypothetical protein Cantr_01769 [Candida viswanathii]|uniref:Striatin N-terminal domain-containing protein n=1 Tax=Candida viswanathii TaxID=5486 RepID=A0A367YJU9_9ASCO|nr:hypothetical protein Cantr_01769 [Candida viswanathii]
MAPPKSSSTNNSQINPQTQWLSSNNNNNNSNNTSNSIGNNSGSNNITKLNQSSSGPDAPYTLPGVINYLTSEFTNLERFKIMTNLEKNEMKFKIIQLQGELTTLKYNNEKQQLKIKELEEENNQLRLKLNGDAKDEIENLEKSETADLNEVDLQMIKKSRQQLTNSMREVVTLLKAPTTTSRTSNILTNNNNNDFDALLNSPDIDQADDFNFNGNSDYLSSPTKKHNKGTNASSIISQFFSGDLTVEEFEKEKINETTTTTTESLDLDDVLERAITNSSDNITVVLDEDDKQQERELPQQDRHHEDDDDDDDGEEVSFDSGLRSPDPSPDPTINDYADSSYNHFDVFNHDKNTIYLNSMSDDSDRQVKMYMVSDHKLIATHEFDMHSSPKKILNLFPIGIPDTLLIIEKDGDIKCLNITDNSVKEHTITSVQATFQDIESCGLIDFSIKSNSDSKYFGLCISGQASQNQQFLLKVYQLSYDLATKTITPKEIGSYNKKFLTKGKSANNVQFAGWFNNENLDNETSVVASTSPKSGNSKLAKKTVSCDDVTLAPYEILYKVDGKTIKLNIVLKQSSVFSG